MGASVGTGASFAAGSGAAGFFSGTGFSAGAAFCSGAFSSTGFFSGAGLAGCSEFSGRAAGCCSAAGSFVPTISGALFDAYGMGGVFGLAAAMYAVFAVCIRLGPETYGMSMEDITHRADATTDRGTMAAEPVKAGA